MTDILQLSRKVSADFSVATTAVRAAQVTNQRIQLYARGELAATYYRLAYWPDQFDLGLLPKHLHATVATSISTERGRLANRSRRTLPDDGILELLGNNAEGDKVLLAMKAHSARCRMLNAQARDFAPDSEAATIDLYAKIVAESHMAAYAYEYFTGRYMVLPGVNWAFPLFVNGKDYTATPTLPDMDWPGGRVVTVGA